MEMCRRIFPPSHNSSTYTAREDMNAVTQYYHDTYTKLSTHNPDYVIQLSGIAEHLADCGDKKTATLRAHEALEAARTRKHEGLQTTTRCEAHYAEYALAVVQAEDGVFDEALPHLFRIMNYAEARQYRELHAKAAWRLGVCYCRIAMFTTALEYLTQARTIAQEISHFLIESSTCTAIGDAHLGREDAQTALQYYREALRLLDITSAENDDTKHSISWKKPSILLNIATAYKYLGGMRQAFVYFEQALTSYKHQENIAGICNALMGIADVYSTEKRYDKALELLFTAFEVAQHHGTEKELGHVQFALGQIYRAVERPETALEYLLASEKLLGASSLLNLIARVHESLSLVYKSLQLYEKAYHHLEAFQAIREQTAMQDGKRAVKYLQQGFEMERAQKEAEIYRLKNVEISHAQQEIERLLLNILPAPIAQRLREGEYRIADSYDAVTVVFIDLVGFTRLAEQYSAVHIVGMLDHLFSEFDDICTRLGLEKIKTIGDAYMAVAGLPFRRDDHVQQAALFALAVQAVMRDLGKQYRVQARIGIHTGSAVAGVIGKSKFVYDIWGDTVNTASRMESHGEAGKVHISNEVYQELIAPISTNNINNNQQPALHTFDFEERGEIEVKGKGLMRTWFLLAPASQDDHDEPVPQHSETDELETMDWNLE
ncbi:MAG: hypothetical protein EAZ92_13235 [Candidatus Kapaibacterium sp.]|nr:MAG: hypothetical protein EAZ92_13235 [Candidatus Kapabacteria bacterium]